MKEINVWQKENQPFKSLSSFFFPFIIFKVYYKVPLKSIIFMKRYKNLPIIFTFCRKVEDCFIFPMVS